MLPDSARSSGRVLSGGHAEDADSSDNMARDIEFDAKRQAPSAVVRGDTKKSKRVVGSKTDDSAALYRLDSLRFLQGGGNVTGGMNLYRFLPLRQMFAQSGGAAESASDEWILARPFKK